MAIVDAASKPLTGGKTWGRGLKKKWGGGAGPPGPSVEPHLLLITAKRLKIDKKCEY